MQRAHRISWYLHNRSPIPKDLYVLHDCDNPLCVNPNHLSLGTHGQNIIDAVTRGLHKAPKITEYIGLSVHDVDFLVTPDLGIVASGGYR